MGSDDTGELWRERAACRGADTAAFYPEGRTPALTLLLAQSAIMTWCRRCEVVESCRAYGDSLPVGWRDGVVLGGHFYEKSATLRRRQRAARRRASVARRGTG